MATIDKSKFQFVKRDDFASETIDAPAYSYWKSVMRQFLKKKSTITMLGILIAIILMSFIYPMFSNFDFNDVSKVNDFSMRYIKPSAQYWFGTDSNGKSLFDGVWFGARNSILISIIATVINLAIGVIIGGIWGISKTVDRVMMEIYNIISNIPALLIVIVLTYSIGAGFWNLIFAMTIYWLGRYCLHYPCADYALSGFGIQPCLSYSWYTNSQDCYEEHYAAVGICYRDHHFTNVAKLYLLRSLSVLLWIRASCNSAKFGTLDLRLFSKCDDECLPLLDSTHNSDFGVPYLLRSWSKLSRRQRSTYT